jgi:hypothetical protein
VLVDADRAPWERRSVVRVMPAVQPRKLAKVPFVELADGRLQGVVSSGSDIARVYVSSIDAAGHGYSCSTNNNRPCGGLGGGLCKHLRELCTAAVAQYGFARVAAYLRVDVDEAATAGSELAGADLVARLRGSRQPAPAATVFSRFLRHLAYLELPETTEPVPELHWFPSARPAPEPSTSMEVPR